MDLVPSRFVAPQQNFAHINDVNVDRMGLFENSVLRIL